MKTKEELDKLSRNIVKAMHKYHCAIFDNLKECGKELSVSGYDDEEEDGLRLTTIGRHQEAVDIMVDKIRYAKHESGVELIEVHICEEDYNGADYWINADILNDDVDYVFDNIEWED